MLPRACTPKWLKLDRKALESTGGLAIYLGGDEPRVTSVAERIGAHPWAETTRALVVAPHGQFAAGRIDKVETAPARK